MSIISNAQCKYSNSPPDVKIMMNVVVRRLFNIYDANIYDADKDVHFVAAVTIALLLVCHIKFRCLLHICVCSQFVNVRIEN